MAHELDHERRNDLESNRTELTELTEVGTSWRSSARYRSPGSSSGSGSDSSRWKDDRNDENVSLWAEIEKLPISEQLRSCVFDDKEGKGKRVIDVTKLGALERHMFMQKTIRHVEHDNLGLLHKIKKRLDRVGVKLPTTEVRFSNLRVEAECMVVHGKPLPTLWNAFVGMLLDITRFAGLSSKPAKLGIINDVSGIVKPGRMTLLLGPPGCGKTSLLKALSANLDKTLEVTGEISYNGYKLKEFVPQKTSSYISQNDIHIPEMTVRETLDFSSHCQGVGSREEIILELAQREIGAKLIPDPDVDTYMKAIAAKGQETTLQTDYILKILGLDICSDTLVGNEMRIGISGGEKKRLTTGEMLVGPTRALFLDEISNGLDSSTTYQIVSCLQQLAHVTDATILVSLLQPPPETFNLFDDIILLAEGKIVYHGSKDDALDFFKSCGFSCPERKGISDFLQEVISRKDQWQYWRQTGRTYDFVSVDMFVKKFQESPCGKILHKDLSVPFDKANSHQNAISFDFYSLSKWSLFKTCISRELLLMKRNTFIYVFKTLELIIVGSVMMTVFYRTHMAVDVVHANYYLGALFYALVILLVDGFPELAMTIERLPVFYKQRDLNFYPAWAYAIPAAVLKIPLSILESILWTSLTYYTVGYTPETERFLSQVMLFFAVHFTSVSLFRFLASVSRTMVTAATAGSLSLIFVCLFGGFVIPKPFMPIWLRWGFWVSPITYGEIGLAVNEFLAPRWQKIVSSNSTMGQEILKSRGLNFDSSLLWMSFGALLGFAVLFNVGFTLALSFLRPPGSRAYVSSEKLSLTKESKSKTLSTSLSNMPLPSSKVETHKGKMVLPFEPLSLVFQNVNYYVETPQAMKERGFTDKRLQILTNVTGAFRPGVLTALMGVSGAGKTTLLDVLAGRKTSGCVEGEIIIGGYPKIQSTFARVSGYCEQTDVHSPQITVEESVLFSAWLRLDASIDSKTKYEFVKEVLETIELDEKKESLVGMPGVDGLSTEQRKRLTIAVELVANPSIIFMDEPTTGLDARAAAIVMRAVKNVADNGRTIVCTIHQPSVDIFEAFDELVLLKTGGRMTYYGPLGQNSCKVVDYFEKISVMPKISHKCNPATWILEITSSSSEAELGVDFSEIYKNSALFDGNKKLIEHLSTPSSGSRDLYFPTPYAQNSWGQFKACLWKQHWSYWRSPSYNLMRFIHTLFTSFIVGLLFWDQGNNINNEQGIISILASMFSATIFSGIQCSSSVLPQVGNERTAFYRERFAGMYASWAYSAAQVVVEVPYMLVQSLAFTVITYPMIGYLWSTNKIFWYFYSMFCTLAYFTYQGMLLVSITPSYPLAAIMQSMFYSIYNLFAGFLIPGPQIPTWWRWFYYVSPTSWTMNGMLNSQYGDIEKEISVFGETKTISSFVRDFYGFHYSQLPLVAVMLMLYPILFASLFAYCIGKLNFQRR